MENWRFLLFCIALLGNWTFHHFVVLQHFSTILTTKSGRFNTKDKLRFCSYAQNCFLLSREHVRDSAQHFSVVLQTPKESFVNYFVVAIATRVWENLFGLKRGCLAILKLFSRMSRQYFVLAKCWKVQEKIFMKTFPSINFYWKIP